MSSFAITAVRPVPAFDSRATPTISCEVRLEGGGRGTAIVPSGASTGTHEAVELRDGGHRYAGRGVDQAIEGIRNKITPALIGLDARDQLQIDCAMGAVNEQLASTGSGRLAALGGNAVLAVSIATALAAADQAGQQPYEFWAGTGEPGRQPLLPLPMINIFSGGAHARAALDVQDLLVVPAGAPDLPSALEWVWEVRNAIATLLTARGMNAQLVADEGGFGVPLANTREGLELIVDGIDAAGLRPGTDVSIAIDVAAQQLLEGSRYRLKAEDRLLTSAELVDEIVGWCTDYPIISVEDPVGEDDWTGFAQATQAMPDQQLLGDDLFVTDSTRLQHGIDAHCGSAVLVKPNQAGSLSASWDVVTTAQGAGLATVLSARSGETENAWLADLAVGWRTGQIKVGSLTRSERTAKWNRLLRIADELGADAEYAGASALVTTAALPRRSKEGPN